MNTFTASARVGADAELKTVGQSQVCSVRLAVSAGFGDRRSTLWINGTLWGNRAQAVAGRLTKGAQIVVSGELSMREFTGRDGKQGQSLELSIDRLDFVGAAGSTDAPRESRQPELQDAIPF